MCKRAARKGDPVRLFNCSLVAMDNRKIVEMEERLKAEIERRKVRSRAQHT